MKIPSKIICPFCGEENKASNTMIAPNRIMYTMFCKGCGAIQHNEQLLNQKITSFRIEGRQTEPINNSEYNGNEPGFHCIRTCEFQI